MDVTHFQPAAMTGVPEHLRRGLSTYILRGSPPGQFLTAVLEHELFEAMGRADEESRARLFDLVSYIYNEAPAGCHGSRERVQEWIEAGGLSRRKEVTA
jgi:hypothetical protein